MASGNQVIDCDKSIESATSQSPRFIVTDTVTVVGGVRRVTRTGIMWFDLSWDDGSLNSVKIELDLISCWVDPNTNECIEAFAVIPDGSRDSAILRRVIAAVPIMKVTNTSGFSITCLGECFRYATRDDACPYDSTDELYNTVEFFPSKHSAIMRVLGHLERYNAIGGFESANLNLVSDELLESVGFFKVNDCICNSSPPYWGVNISEMFDSGGVTGYREKEQQTIRMAVLFADKLRKSIEGHE